MSVFRALSILCLTAGLVSAQQGPSPLVGKTVRVFNPEPGGPLNVDMSGTGYPMTSVGNNWMTFTIPATIQFHITKFGVRNDYGQGTFWISKTGVSNSGNDAYGEEDFAGKDTLWIVVDPSGPATAPPTLLTEAPKVINVFNPWPTTAPVMRMADGTRKGMLTVPDNCGWFWAFVMTPAERTFHLEEVNAADSYGTGGLGNRTPYNLTTEFASKGSPLWLDTDINAWLATDPKKNRSCGYQMAAIVRDFSQAHDDFDFGQAPDAIASGMVEEVLPANRKPVRTAKTNQYFNKFQEWFNTTPGSNEETCVDIPMTHSDNGMWMYDSYMTPEHGFYPIDNFTTTAAGTPNPHNQKNVASCYVKPDGNTWVQNQPMHNLNFCMESHATFIYQKGQKFEFRGDDDVWVYINNKLVIDLGGLHIPKSDTVDLDELNLVPGKTYNWDFYYCERQPCGSSLRIKTSIYFKQQRALEAVMDSTKPGSFSIHKYSGGTGACGSFADTVKEVPVPAGSLIYKLWNASGTELETLGEGSFHNGGIIIATPSVVVDTAKIQALPPGNYRVVAFESASPAVKAEVPFVIANRSWVQFVPKDTTATAGALIPVVAENRIGTAAPTGAMGYSFTVQPPAGLLIFGNSAGTVPATTSGSTGADGLDTFWVSVDPDIRAPVTYSLVTANSQRQVKVTFTRRPVRLPLVTSASIHDDDADGIADRIVAVYDTSITGNLPKQVAYRWPASGSIVTTPGSALGAPTADGTTLTLSGKPLVDNVATAGPGVLLSTYPYFGQDSVQSAPLTDRIAPVLLQAVMLPGTSSDTLRLVFSEPINTGAITAASADLFIYRLSQAGADLHFPSSGVNWNSTRDTAFVIFQAGSVDAPRSGNLVRIADGAGRLADAAGNGAGPNSRFRLITGLKQAAVLTETFITVDPAKANLVPAPILVSLEARTQTVKQLVEKSGRLGHLVKVDLGDYAQADDFTPVDPSQVFLEYQVAYFDNHAVPVAKETRMISCQDPIFNGDCRATRGYLFVSWNFTTLKQQRVATGAYVARFRYKVIVAGKAAVSGALDQVWGVLRSR